MGFSYKRFQPSKLSFDNGVFANNNYSYQDFKSHDYSGQNTEVMDITPDNNMNNDNHVTEKGIPFEYDSSRHGAGGYTIYYKNNEPIAIHYDNTNIVKAIDSLSCYRLDSEKNLLYPVSIYDDENISSNQYGADQGAMAHNFEGYIKRPEIWDEMQKYYQNCTLGQHIRVAMVTRGQQCFIQLEGKVDYTYDHHLRISQGFIFD